MKSKQNILFYSLLFCLLLAGIGFSSVSVLAAETNQIISGKCGENVYYEYNPSTETMRIYGEGTMYDYNKFVEHPWYKEAYALNIKKVKIEDGVTSVGRDAFCCDKNRDGEFKYGCGNLTSVEIADTVTNIGDNAFYGCALTSIKFPDSLETIGAFAFSDTSLSEIKWGSSLKSIGSRAFECIDIQELILPQNVESIGYLCFAFCYSLEKTIIPDNCEMHDYVFSYCNALDHIVIGSNCKISSYVFNYCNKLESVEIGFNCEVGGFAFYECTSLSRISIGEGSKAVIDSEGGFIFYNCSSLETILLPDSWEFGEDAYNSQFCGCTNLTDINFSATNTKYKIIDNVIYSKDGSKIMYYPAGLKEPEYEILDGTTSIAATAFEGQNYLEYVTIPDSVQELGYGAFVRCSKLNNVIVPEGVQELGERVFGYCDTLNTIVLPVSLKSIEINYKEGSSTFYYTYLEVIYAEEDSYAQEFAGDKFKQIIYCMFDADGGLVVTEKKPVIYNRKYNTLPIPEKEGYKFGGWYTVKGDKITNDTVVSSLDSHTLYAYWEKDQDNSLENIDYEYSKLSEGTVIINKYIGTERDIVIPTKIEGKNVTNIDFYAFMNNNDLKSVIIPESVTNIGGYAFFGCSKLESVSIPEHVTSIGSYAFWGCSENISLVVHNGSYAESYAKENGLKYNFYVACDHDYQVIITKATTKKDGTYSKVCTKCGDIESVTTIYAAKTIELFQTSYIYDGKTQKPAVSIKDSRGKDLKNKSDYTISYPKAIKNVGNYTVTIKFKGNYSGTVKKTFTIVPAGTSISKVIPKKKGFTVKWKKQTTQITGYEIAYSTNSKFSKKNTKNVSIGKNNVISKSVNKLKSKKKYYLRIRTYKMVKGKKYYSEWSKLKKITTKK